MEVRRRLSAVLHPGQEAAPKGCYKCGTLDELIELRGQLRVCHKCRTTICHYCGKMPAETDKPFKTCGACHEVAYCGIVCQRRDWRSEHKGKCIKK